MAGELDFFISRYFQKGYCYKEILGVLRARHNTSISVRQLHRHLRRLGLYRNGYHSETSDVIAFVQSELLGSGSSIGYRAMHQRCVNKGLRMPRESVAIIQKELDPEGVELRKRHCLRRRLYYAKGPNWVWHMDGYDKLKPYGLCIHGAIDGYSRRILWLRLCRSNKDPKVVCSVFMKALQKIKGAPRKVVGDRGTENVYVAAAQRFFRRSHTDASAGFYSFRYGKSVSNQRIEAWWAMLRRSCTGWWINFFRDLIEQGMIDITDPIHVECVRFCFAAILQKELNQMKTTWNNHRIRRSVNSNQQHRPPGRPNILYFAPSTLEPSIQDHKKGIDNTDKEVVQELCCNCESKEYICTDEFFTLASVILSEQNLNMPNTPIEALRLYTTLISHINRI